MQKIPKKKLRKQQKPKGEIITRAVLRAPMTIWAILFIVAPMVLLAVMSFLTKGPLGMVQYKFTLENYTELANPVYAEVIEQSLIIAGWTTALTVLFGYPLAAFIAKVRTRTSAILTILLMLPLWVSGLVVLYSFVILLNSSGIINTFLEQAGVIDEPLELLYNNFAVVVGMIYMFLPFAVLPMYSSIEKLDHGLIEASKDLGAGPVKTFFRVSLPLTMPGIVAAIILTFIPCIGYYMVTDLLGGGTNLMIGNLIYRQFTISRNWPFGAALSMVLALIIFLMLLLYTRFGGDLDDLGA